MDYRYSYSGADATAFAWYEGVEEQIVRLESLHTVSMSVHEAKGQVRTLGYRGIRGLTRSVRTIAGSMIFVVIDDHPLRQMMRLAVESPRFHRLGWSEDRDQVGTGSALSNLDFTNRLGTLLPPMHMLVTYVHEVQNLNRNNSPELVNQIAAGQTSDVNIQGAALLLKDLEFLDEGLVTSVNDIVSEITYSFIARDYKELSMMDKAFSASQPKWTAAQNEEQNRKQAMMRRAMGMPANNFNINADNASRQTNIVDEDGQTVDVNALTGWQQRALRDAGATIGAQTNRGREMRSN